MTIELEQATREAVKFCLSMEPTSGTKALARVILHCYNHYDYPLSIVDLCLLDDKRQALAWAVLRLRVAGVEPHEVLEQPIDLEYLKERYAPKKDLNGFFYE